MSQIQQDLHYTKTHEWVRNNNDGTWTMGITDCAQDLLGDIVFIELPNINDPVETQAELCVVESVKAASSVYAPANLVVLEVNDTLDAQPEIINQDCYDQGWLVTFKADNLDGLLTADAYQTLLDSE